MATGEEPARAKTFSYIPREDYGITGNEKERYISLVMLQQPI
jgi:hypothetical protein